MIEKPYMELVVEKDGEEMKLPRFQWKDGRESALMDNGSGRDVSIDSTKEVIACSDKTTVQAIVK